MGGSAWSNQIVNKLIIAGPNGGEFLYSPTTPNPSTVPGLNNLIESNVAVAGTDATGKNATLAGLTTYTWNATFSLWFAVSHQLDGLYYFFASTEAGPWTQITRMATVSRIGTPALYLLNIGDGSAGVSVNIQNPLHQSLVLAQPGSGPPEVAETWHDMTPQNGWTNGSNAVAQYKLLMDSNRVAVRANNLVPGTTTDGTALWNIPAVYTPTTPNSATQNLTVNPVYSAAPAYGSHPFVAFRNGGTMTIQNLRGTVSSISFLGSYSLD